MEPQQVVLIQGEAADGRLGFYSAMGTMPVVAMEPCGQLGGALVWAVIGLGVSPFPQGRLDEALGLAVGLGRVGLGADVVQAELGASRRRRGICSRRRNTSGRWMTARLV